MKNIKYDKALSIESLIPTESIKILVEALLPLATKVDTYWVAERESGFIIITKGTVEVLQPGANKIIWEVRSPNILGIVEYFCGVKITHYRNTSGECYFVPFKHAQEVISQNINILPHLSAILALHCYCLLHRNVQLSHINVDEIVKSYLLEIVNIPFPVREHINVTSYICEKVDISKSSVMRALKDMKDNKKIVMHRGALISIDDV